MAAVPAAAPLPLAPAAQAVPAALPPTGQAPAAAAGPSTSMPPPGLPSAAAPLPYAAAQPVPAPVHAPQGVTGAPTYLLPQTAVPLQQQQPLPQQPGYPGAAGLAQPPLPLPTTASVASSIGPVVLAARPRSAGAPLQTAPAPGGIAQQQQQPGCVPMGQPPIISGAFNGGVRPLGVHAPIDDYFLASRSPGLAPPASAAAAQRQASGAAGRAGSVSVPLPHGQVPSSHDCKDGASAGAMFRGKLTKGEQAILKHREQNRHW
jgi:hypothetical protein